MSDNEYVKLKREQNREERRKKVEAAKLNAKNIGKEPFDLNELNKYWSYRFEAKLSQAELMEDMKIIEDRYYLAGDEFMTMEAYGKYLMEMELYR